MAELSKQALKVENQTSFPNNNTNYITPAILRDYNVDIIDSTVNQTSYNTDSGSWNQQINALEAFTASATGLTTGSLLITASATNNTITFTKGNGSTFNVVVATGSIPDISNLNQATASLNAYTQSATVKFNNIESTTASLNTSVTNINGFTASTAVSITNINSVTASQQTSINNLNAKTGSYATTGSNTFVGANTFTSISASSFVSASGFVGDGSKLTGITSSFSGIPILDEGIPQGTAVSLNFTGSGISAIIVGGTAVISVNTPDSGTINNLTASFNAYTASTNLDLAAIHQATSSLQQFTASFNTASFVGTASFNSFTSSTNTATASLFTSTSLSLTTASFDNGTRNLTFTKGNGTQFSLNIPDVSGSTNYVTTSSFNAYTASNDQRVSSLETATGSLFTSASLSLTTASIAAQLMTFRKGDGTTFNLTIPTGSSVYVTGSFGAFSDTTTQSGSANTPYAFKFNTTDIPDGVQLSGSTGLQVGAAGTYNIQFSAQGVQGAGAAVANIWFKKNGTNIPNSDTQITLPSNQKLVAAWNIFSTANIGDTFELWWQSDSSNTTWASSPASGSAPGIPSIIATVNRVDTGGGSNLVSTSSFNAYTASINSATASLFTSASLALTTASVSGTTMTFTKGNGTTFNVTLPTGSGGTINTGSFATTGSNTFNGNQTINGALTVNTQPITANSGIYVLQNSGLQIQQNIEGSGSQYPNFSITVDSQLYPTDIYGGLNIADSNPNNPVGTFVQMAANSYTPEFGPEVVGWIGGGFPNAASSNTAIIFRTGSANMYVYKPTIFGYDVYLSGSLTASLQQGYTYVGNASGKTTTVATSSFGTPIPAGTISSSAQITALGFVSSSITASSIVTASVNLNTITFTKGDSSTFALTVNTGSGGGGAAFPYAGTASISGSLQVTGSMSGLPITLSVVANTASIDMTAGNQFVLTLPSSSTTHIAPSSIKAGQTINLLIKQQVGPGTGSIAFAPSILFPSGLDMQATATGSAIDLISMISFDTTNLMAANVKNLK